MLLPPSCWGLVGKGAGPAENSRPAAIEAMRGREEHACWPWSWRMAAGAGLRRICECHYLHFETRPPRLAATWRSGRMPTERTSTECLLGPSFLTLHLLFSTPRLQKREDADASEKPKNGGQDLAVYYESLEDSIRYAGDVLPQR